MAKTERETVVRAMRIIRLVASDEEPADDDYQDALAEYKGVHDLLQVELKDKHRIHAGWDANSVPDNAFPFVARILAESLLAVFPVPESVVVNEGEAMANLVKLFSKRRSAFQRFPDFPAGQPETWRDYSR